jgi:hypothetical protein
MGDPSIGRKTDGTFGKGNPGGGRPKMPDDLKEAFKAAAPEALATLLNVMRNGDKGSDRVKASEAILDRGYGKPVQSIEAEVSDLRPILFDAVLGRLVKTDADSKS